MTKTTDSDGEVSIARWRDLLEIYRRPQDGHIRVEKINGPFLFELKGTPAEHEAGLEVWARACHKPSYIPVIRLDARRLPTFS